MKDLKTLLEGSLLADVEDTIKAGNKYENINLKSLYNSKSKEEFEAKFKVFKSMIEDKNTEVTFMKSKKTYIIFQEYFPKKYDIDLCYLSIFIGTDKDLYRIAWVHDNINKKHRVRIERKELINLEYIFNRKDFRNAKRNIYVCPKKIEDEANKLIIYNLE